MIAGERVKMRIGEVKNTSFYFMSGATRSDLPSASIGIYSPTGLAAGQIFETNGDDLLTPAAIYEWRDSQSGQINYAMQGASQKKNVSLRLEEVTDHVVIGEISITGKDPEVDLSGKFRLAITIPRTSK